jgi:hypothetical protein
MRVEGPNGEKPEDLPVRELNDEIKAMGTVSTPPRPSLDCEMEVHDNLSQRIHAHVNRMLAWDTRKLDIERRVSFVGAASDLKAACTRVARELLALKSAGFIAKTTPATRILSKLEVGARVLLKPAQCDVFAEAYSREQLSSLRVVRVAGNHVQLEASDGTGLGLVKLCHIALPESPDDTIEAEEPDCDGEA